MPAEAWLSRAEMEQGPYRPTAGAQNDFQNSHSLQYIAFYLGEINAKLGRLVDAVETGKVTANVGQGLHGVAEAIRQKT